ncbi:MAG: zinc protease [Planctomycetota bacterium]|jgi:zinc protease
MIDFNEFELANGLKVIVHEDTTTPIATFNLLYNVGAKDENEKKTGFAHFFEHFMFEGSKNIKNYDTEMQIAGGDNNAFTTNDLTNYYETLPASNIETAFWLESDRMLELDFNQKSLDTQISVVSEEFKENYINKPYGDMWHILSDMCYTKHPYRWPTIGYNLDHIANIKMQDTKDFFYKYYRPNNAVLTIAGGVKTSEMERLTKKWFGDIERGDLIVRDIPREPKQTAARRKTVEGNVPVDAIMIAYHICSRIDDKYYATDLVSDLLGTGTSSRLYLELVQEKHLFSYITCYVSGYDDEGLLVFDGKLSKGVSLEDAEKGILECIENFKSENVSERELEKVVTKTLNYLAFSNISNVNISFNMAYFETIGEMGLINGETQKYNEVTSQQIFDVANDIFRTENSNTLYYKAKSSTNE